MRKDYRKRTERAKQRGNTKRPSGNDGDAAVPEPFEIDNDNRDDNLFSKDSDNDNGGNDPDYDNDPDADNDPNDDSDPTTNTLSQLMTRIQRRRTEVKEKTPQVPSGFPEMLTGHA